jgi:D-alanyl-D-alanine carboxypeptidase
MKKRQKIIMITIGILLVLLLVLLLVFGFIAFLGSRPIDKATAIAEINDMVGSQVGKKNVTQAIVYVDSLYYGVSEIFVHGELDGAPIKADQPFHVASVGKAFTATLIGVLVDESKITLDDRISSYLPDEILEGLFVYQGTDYQDEVTVGQLLNHTSGIADYWEDTTEGSPSMQELIISDPDKFWTPEDLVAYSHDHQLPIGSPGGQYHYSDTGYILLGMIIESVSGHSFDAMLQDKIFVPLNMNDTYLMFYSEPVNGFRPIADGHLGDVNVKDFQSLSIDWAGGGIVSTANDLAIFIRALNNNEIIGQRTLNNLYQFDHKFMNGIHYGYGFMEYHFGEFFPTLKSLPNYTGHMGVLGTQMFYSKSTDTVYISSFGSTDFAAGSVQTLIEVLMTLERIE